MAAPAAGSAPWWRTGATAERARRQQPDGASPPRKPRPPRPRRASARSAAPQSSWACIRRHLPVADRGSSGASAGGSALRCRRRRSLAPALYCYAQLPPLDDADRRPRARVGHAARPRRRGLCLARRDLRRTDRLPIPSRRTCSDADRRDRGQALLLASRDQPARHPGGDPHQPVRRARPARRQWRLDDHPAGGQASVPWRRLRRRRVEVRERTTRRTAGRAASGASSRRCPTRWRWRRSTPRTRS